MADYIQYTGPTHYVKKCRKCDDVISQCRCPAKDKRIEYGICESCKQKEN